MNASPEQIIRDFCDAWSRKNIDELMSFFAQDAVYHNIPVAPVKGAAAIRAAFLGFVELMDSIDLDVLAIAAHGNIVFTERVDRFRWQGKRLDLPVAWSSRLAVAILLAIATTSITRRGGGQPVSRSGDGRQMP